MSQLQQSVMLRLGKLLPEFEARGLHIAAAESLTGGMLSAAIVDVPGASKVLLGSVVAYTNSVKAHLLGVDFETLEVHGAVSAQTATEMAHRVRVLLGDAGGVSLASTIGIATTGVAGPDADGEHQPGEVFIAAEDQSGETHIEHHHFAGSRAEVREATLVAAVELLSSLLAK